MIEGDMELSHLIEEYNQSSEAEKEQYKQDTLEQLQRLAILYKHQNQDELGVLTVIAEALGFKAYPGQSMMGEDVMHFLIGNKEEGYGLMDMIYNCCPDEEIVEQLLADDDAEYWAQHDQDHGAGN